MVINTNDPLSVRIGEYYAAQRRLSFQNILRIELPPGRSEITRQEFEEVKRQVDIKTLPMVQAFALTWTVPYRVECMSITSAFAFGFDPAFCEPGCGPTRPSPYYNSSARLPFAKTGIRPAMSIAATSFDQAKALIDRGVASDGSIPRGAAYLLSTSDAARNVRSALFANAQRRIDGRIPVHILKQDRLEHATDVLFYFTGMKSVDGLKTLRFVPGAIADHLTSGGGRIAEPAGAQMSVLKWLEAGATGSYGAVVEPCNLPQKFPNPAVVADRYLGGDTLIEAYWKGVAMPGQGLFVGEPLAAPFRARTVAD